MRRQQVEAIFGERWAYGSGFSISYPEGVGYWYGPAGEACVEFDWKGEVVSATFVRARHETLLARLRAWLGW